MINEEKKGSSTTVRVQEPEQTPPRENTAAWVEKYVTWASQVLEAHATKKTTA
jgi:hypothetical protein